MAARARAPTAIGPRRLRQGGLRVLRFIPVPVAAVTTLF